MGAQTFGVMLRRYRKSAGLSQETLAERVGISTESIGALERGVRRAPHRDTVALLCVALELNEAERPEFEDAAARGRARTGLKGGSGRAVSERRLPLQTTSLIGRARDVEAIAALFEHARLVTVTGPGGVGKTRVALEVASRSLRGERPLYFVDLGALSDGSHVPVAIATMIRSDFGGRPATLEELVAELARTPAILFLDNCEHVVADTAHVVSTILRSCADISFLATSRERLAVGGEVVYRLPNLDTPRELPANLQDARRYAAVELFIERAASFDRAFVPSDASVDDLVDVCRRLDGIPLAIELAAARIATLGLHDLRERLRDGLELTGGARNLPARQQAIAATIAWSYDLLEQREQMLLQNLSVFPGDFTLAAARLVSMPELSPQETTDAIGALVDKSLLNAAFDKGVARYSLLGSVRAYAAERAKIAGRFDPIARRYDEFLATPSGGAD